ncbi:MAG: hypothetical protein WCK78_08405 [Paludibacter sp.]
MNKLTIFVLLILIVTSCQSDLEYKLSGYTQKIIVEGYISNGEFPKVYLTLNFPLSKTTDSINMLENVIRTAKVTISDGVNSEILTSGWETNKRHFPPYMYVGTELKGQEGKTYYLTVDFSGYTLHATTTIPYAATIQKFESTAIKSSVNYRNLFMTINIDPVTKNSYRVFSLKKKDGYFIETQYVYNSEFSLSGTNKFIISPRATELDSSFTEGGSFIKGDTVLVKLCTIDSVSTQFFKALTLFSSSTGIGNDLFIGEKDKLKSNISSPGFGIWYGNGVRYYTVIIE